MVFSSMERASYSPIPSNPIVIIMYFYHFDAPCLESYIQTCRTFPLLLGGIAENGVLSTEESSNNCSTPSKLQLKGYNRLRRIEIGSQCFGNVVVFELDSLTELESIEIGESCFLRSEEGDNGSLRIVNCPKLRSIRVGDQSFNRFHSFELRNLPSLQTIQAGDVSFCEVTEWSLTGILIIEVSFRSPTASERDSWRHGLWSVLLA